MSIGLPILTTGLQDTVTSLLQTIGKSRLPAIFLSIKLPLRADRTEITEQNPHPSCTAHNEGDKLRRLAWVQAVIVNGLL